LPATRNFAGGANQGSWRARLVNVRVSMIQNRSWAQLSPVMWRWLARHMTAPIRKRRGAANREKSASDSRNPNRPGHGPFERHVRTSRLQDLVELGLVEPPPWREAWHGRGLEAFLHALGERHAAWSMTKMRPEFAGGGRSPAHCRDGHKNRQAQSAASLNSRRSRPMPGRPISALSRPCRREAPVAGASASGDQGFQLRVAAIDPAQEREASGWGQGGVPPSA